MADNLSLAVDGQGVALVRLHVADTAQNFFSPGLAADLYAVAAEVNASAAVRGVLLTSARDNGFLAGARLEGLLSGGGEAPGAAAVAALLAPVHGLMRGIERGGKPWVAAINGLALGGGFELCLACHERLLVDDPAAEIGLPELDQGLIPGGGGTQRLPRLLGLAAALPLLLQSRRLHGRAALDAGLVHQLLPRDQLLAAAHARVLALAEQDAHDGSGATQPWDRRGWSLPGGPPSRHAALFGLALARARRDGGPRQAGSLALLEAVYEGSTLPLDRALALEAQCFATLVAGGAQ